MKVVVDWMRCDGNGVCVVEAPGVFELNDEDDLVLLEPEPGESDRAAVEAAVAACPKRALTLQP
jgi:ferredoxin